ncbi:hypothetical protein GCM10027075_22510 [Streptomyces heilongjiangensis]
MALRASSRPSSLVWAVRVSNQKRAEPGLATLKIATPAIRVRNSPAGVMIRPRTEEPISPASLGVSCRGWGLCRAAENGSVVRRSGGPSPACAYDTAVTPARCPLPG